MSWQFKCKTNANDVNRRKKQKGQDRVGGRLTKHAKMHICWRIEASGAHKHHSHALPTNTYSVILHPSLQFHIMKPHYHIYVLYETIIYLNNNGFGNLRCEKVACSTCLENSLTPLRINVDKLSSSLITSDRAA